MQIICRDTLMASKALVVTMWTARKFVFEIYLKLRIMIEAFSELEVPIFGL